MEEKNDITAKRLYLQALAFASEGGRPPNYRKMEVFGRHSDAFVYVRGGRCYYAFSDGAAFLAKAGDVVFLPKGSAYSMTHYDDRYTYIYFDFFFASDAPLRPGCYPMRNPEEAERLFARMLRGFSDFPTGTFCECAELFYRIYGAVLQSGEAGYLAASVRQKILRAGDWLEAHYADRDLNVPDLARAAGVSETYFRRTFRVVYGDSPTRRLNAIRLRHAAQMLGDRPDLSLDAIAELTGFSTVQYMSALFRRAYGMAPGQYRRCRAKT